MNKNNYYQDPSRSQSPWDVGGPYTDLPLIASGDANRIEYAPHSFDIRMEGEPTIEHLGGWRERVTTQYSLSIQKYFDIESNYQYAEITLWLDSCEKKVLDDSIDMDMLAKKVAEYSILAEEFELGR